MKKVRFIGLLISLLVSLFVGTPVSSQDTSDTISPPQVIKTVDENWNVINVLTVGEQSCITVEGRSGEAISRCFDSPRINISQTIPIPSGGLTDGLFMTRVSVTGNAKPMECLLVTSYSSSIKPILSCPTDVVITNK